MTDSFPDPAGDSHQHGRSTVPLPRRFDATAAAARATAYLLLRPLPARWAHSQAVAAQAGRIASTVAPADRELLVAAAWLHDIGYAPLLIDTGFHPLDGAIHLIQAGAPARLAALVAHHSEARLLARPRGLLNALDEFPAENGPVMDALVYADMTADATGKIISVPRRLADIRTRHATERPDLFAARCRREPRLLAATARVALRRRDNGPRTHLPAAGRGQPGTGVDTGVDTGAVRASTGHAIS
ncbi:HD domain-containing protein [Frankia sp. Cj5]|uniref:HD domain-containing protein n=1 Tax=Frankia sp. Cj5 TaxID=2880978 RepID=UPI001EF4C661|nr:HD domain-containing protein [Frankia sp. Cj5]